MITNTKSQEWQTPQSLFDGLNSEFRFDIDAAATAQNAKCAWFLGDALTSSVPDRTVWCNPPFGQVAPFLTWAITQMRLYDSRFVFLLPANVDTRWFHELVMPRANVSFFRGRVKYVPPPKEEEEEFLDVKSSSPSFPSMLATFGYPKHPINTRDSTTGAVLPLLARHATV